MDYYKILITLVGCILIFIKLLGIDNNEIDYYVIIIYIIMFIPYFSKYLNNIKLSAFEINFKKEIKNVKSSVEASKKLKKDEVNMTDNRYRVFDLSKTKSLINSDPVLALASLRIEIESKILSYFTFHNINIFGLNEMIKYLVNKNLISLNRGNALKAITKICNIAIHGGKVTKEDASQVINIAEEFNEIFSLGYSFAFMPNDNFSEEGLICKWEHCIENMPLPYIDTNTSCPIFGHTCPGGIIQVNECKEEKNIIE